jgi:hypothetical protein
MEPFGCADKPAEKHCWLICCERKILFRLKKMDYKLNEHGLYILRKYEAKNLVLRRYYLCENVALLPHFSMMMMNRKGVQRSVQLTTSVHAAA